MADLRAYEEWAKLRAHRERVDRSRRAIEKAFALGRAAVSTSWGKDSVALCDLVIETIGDAGVDLLHMASPYALPGYDSIVDYFSSRARVHIVPSRKTLAEYIAWLREIGLGYERPTRRKEANRRKHDVASDWCQENGFDVQLLGLRAEESAQRKGLLLGRGSVYRRRTDGLWIAHPLAWWTVRDVWARIVSRGLPYHRLYDCETHGMTRETLRNSGWLTTIDAGEGRIGWLRQHFQEQYRELVTQFPRVGLLG